VWGCFVASWTKALWIVGLVACGGGKSAGERSGEGDTANVNPADTGTLDACATSVVDYENYGQGFMMTWCTPCHNSALEPGGSGENDPRSGAPEGVDFNTNEGVQLWRDRIIARATGGGPTMPPGGGPTSEDLALLLEWLECGAPEHI
jgi:uncharacterized membrane protein